MKVLICILFIIPATAFADIETDKSAGNCMGYFATQQKESGMRAALTMADNKKRTMKFADTWLNNAERYKDDKGALSGMVYSANSDCRKIGIKPSDY